MTIALGIRYLTGRAVATAVNNYNKAEWPPHPARVFMAMAAAHFEDPPADTQEREKEYDALRWLETLDPPVIIASNAAERSVATCYVPVNDTRAPITGSGSNVKALAPLQCMPLGRIKKGRTFPSVYPDTNIVYLVWGDGDRADAYRCRISLECICQRVTRIGHSSSLVQMWVEDHPPIDAIAWRPDEQRGAHSMRVPSRGLLDSLLDEHKSGIRPIVGTWCKYRRGGEESAIPGTIWNEAMVALRLSPLESRHRRLDLCTTLSLTRRLHKAVQNAASGAGLAPIPEWLSGHRSNGSPSELPHVAFFPLAFVGRPHADGHLLGLAVAIPENISGVDIRLMLRALGNVTELRLGRLGRWKLAPVQSDTPPWNLQAEAWTAAPQGATRWASVTPVVFDRHPKAKDRAQYERVAIKIIRRSCERIGLPDPCEIILTPVSAHLGAPASHEFPRMIRKDGSERQHRHAILIFDQPVRGPIAIGAGRYRGYGFCRPLKGEG